MYTSFFWQQPAATDTAWCSITSIVTLKSHPTEQIQCHRKIIQTKFIGTCTLTHCALDQDNFTET